MKNFAQGQRWISEMEPELGLGTVLEISNGRVQVYFTASGEMRMYASQRAPLRRVEFRIGDTITSHENESYIVTGIVEENDLFIYEHEGGTLPEVLLSDHISFHTAEDRLLNNQFDSYGDYRLRQNTLEMEHYRRKSPVRGFLGGRIDLIPHQLYIAHEVSSRQAPRVLLSDEVGLGKTIEACLIVHRLLLSGRASRVLIVVPESLVHQWFVELYRRFTLWFNIYDEERSAAIEGEEENVNPFLDDQLVLCSQQFLTSSPKRARQVIDAGWDLLVVDEAHHLEWNPEEASPAYRLVELLSKRSDGLLLLTATPEQLGKVGHFARLRLLDPDRYNDFEAYVEEEDFQAIADVAEKLMQEKQLDETDAQVLISRFGEDEAEKLNKRLEAIAEGNADKRQHLLEDLLDLHGPGRVLFRNTRAAIQGFPKRIATLYALEAEEKWVDAAAKEFSAEDGQKYTFDEDPRMNWLVDWIKALKGEKALLICRTKEKALALDAALRKRMTVKVGVFHEDLTLVQRDRNAAWFAEEDGAQLLLCSEIGSEGRNFQFTHNLVLFDLPHHPELLEQRIGRLDRIGQKQDIQIHIPYVVGSPQEVLARWYHVGLNAFEESLIGGASIMDTFGDRVRTVATEDKSSLEDLLAETKVFRDDLRQKLDAGRNRLLEMNSFRPEKAEALIEDIKAEDEQSALEAYLDTVYDHYGIQSEELAPRTYFLKPGPSAMGGFPEVSEEGISLTCDRQRALTREDIGFLTWDHPLVSGVMDMILGSEKGNSTFGVFPGGLGPHALWLEVTFVLEAVASSELHADRFLPPTPVRVLVDKKREDISSSYPSELLDQQLVIGDPAQWLSASGVTQRTLRGMIKQAKRLAEKQSSTIIDTSYRRMVRLLDYEMHRLHELRKMNSAIREEELERAIEHRQLLSEAITGARLRVDSLRLIGIRG